MWKNNITFWIVTKKVGKERNKSSRWLQSWPWNPRKQWHLPSTQSPLKVHELGQCPDPTTGPVLHSSWYAGQINSPTDRHQNLFKDIREEIDSVI